jgi:hypothetical protein
MDMNYYVNGKIFTGQGEDDFISAFQVVDGMITWVGEAAEVPDDDGVDLGGKNGFAGLHRRTHPPALRGDDVGCSGLYPTTGQQHSQFRRAYALKDMYELATLGLSLDSPATTWMDPDNVFTSIKAAVVRKAYNGAGIVPDQAITVPQAVLLYTGRARQVANLPGVGEIAPGFDANFITSIKTSSPSTLTSSTVPGWMRRGSAENRFISVKAHPAPTPESRGSQPHPWQSTLKAIRRQVSDRNALTVLLSTDSPATPTCTQLAHAVRGMHAMHSANVPRSVGYRRGLIAAGHPLPCRPQATPSCTQLAYAVPGVHAIHSANIPRSVGYDDLAKFEPALGQRLPGMQPLKTVADVGSPSRDMLDDLARHDQILDAKPDGFE